VDACLSRCLFGPLDAGACSDVSLSKPTPPGCGLAARLKLAHP